MRAGTRLRGVRRPTILDDGRQTPNEDLEMFVCTPRGDDLHTPRGDDLRMPRREDPSEPRRLLLAIIETHHDQLREHIEENRKRLLEHIDMFTWPCQKSKCDSMIGRAPPDTSSAGQASKRQNPSERVYSGNDEHLFIDSRPEATSGDIPSASNMRTETTSTRVGDGLFRVPVPKWRSNFDVVVCILIVFNAVFIAAQGQWEGYKASVALGLRDDDSWDGAKSWFDALQHVFAILFLLELCMRVHLLKVPFFVDAANWFDMFLVFSNILELYILTPLGTASGMNFTMLRIIRLCKVLRVFRVLRVTRFFRSLHVLVSAIFRSMASLFWSMVVLSIMIMLGGLLMCQTLAEYIMDENNPMSTRKWVYNYYGGFARATLSMFEVTMSGCWPNYSRRLVEEVSVWFVVFFILYISGVVFAITRIISALFLKDTLHAANNEADHLVCEMNEQRNALMCKLRHFFREADQSGDGLMDASEFQAILSNPKVRLWLRGLEWQMHDCAGAFRLIDNGSGVVSVDEFMAAMQRLRGSARSVDLAVVAMDVAKIKRDCLQMDRRLQKFCTEADAQIDQLAGADSAEGEMSKVR